MDFHVATTQPISFRFMAMVAGMVVTVITALVCNR